jgi:predicted MFS family arabinose efflux permease
LTTKQSSFVLLLFGAGALAGLMSTGIARARGHRRIIHASLLGQSVLCILLAFSEKWSVLVWVAVPTLAMAAYLLGPIMNAEAFEILEGNSVMAGAAIVSSFNLGNLGGPAISGELASRAGWTAVPVFAAASLGASICVFTFTGDNNVKFNTRGKRP